MTPNGPSPSPSPSPSPQLIFEALGAHLTPSPLLSHLPTTLRLFAHLQILSLKIQTEATRALTAHLKLARKLEKQGFDLREQVLQGALSEKDGHHVQDIRRSRQEASSRMLAFSIEFRRHHIVTLLITPKIPFGQIKRILDTYFPHLPPENEDKSNFVTVEKNPELYIRCMAPEHLSAYRHYETTITGWYDRAKILNEKGEPPLLYTDFSPDDKDNGQSRQATLCRNMLREAEKVLDDMSALQRIFSEGTITPPPQTLQGRPAASLEGLPEATGSYSAHRYAPAENGKERATKINGNPNGGPLKHPSTVTSPSVNPPENSGSPGKVHNGSPPPIYTSQIATQLGSPPVKLETSSPSTGSRIRGSPHVRRPEVTKQNDQTRRQTLPASMTVITPSTSISETASANRKRPRQSLPSTSGPDYTVPLRSFHFTGHGKQTEKEKQRQHLKPFSNSDMHRGKISKV